MNLLLLPEANFHNENLATVKDPRQLKHIDNTLKSDLGSSLNVGQLNGKMGTGVIVGKSSTQIELEVSLSDNPPEALPLTLILALPRPKMLKRTIQSFTSLGVKKVYFINSWKVEKSYWQSPWVQPDKLKENCLLGLEQAKDTVLPEIQIRKLFKPFVEDELPELAHDTRALVAHPDTELSCPVNITEPATLAIGPEGGFTPYEVGKLKEAGLSAVHLGARILRVETAVPAIISRLYCPR